MKKLVLVPHIQSSAKLPESAAIPPQQAAMRWRGTLVGCALSYILCVLATTAPIYNMVGFQTQFWISVAMVKVDSWLQFPRDLGFSADHYVSQGDTIYVEFLLLTLLAFAIYGLCAYLLQQVKTQSDSTFVLRLIWLTVIVSGCIYLFTPASSSDDVYGYASYGRLLSVHYANPYIVPPSAYQQDPTYALIHWKDSLSVYGPVWTVISALVGLVSGPDRLSYLIAFRLCAFAAHLLNIWLVTAILRTLGRSPRTVALGTLLYAWNPLVLLESCYGGHNDVLMVACLLLGLLLSARAERNGTTDLRGSLPALLAFTLAGLVKLTAIPIIAFPILKLFWNIYHAATPTVLAETTSSLSPSRVPIYRARGAFVERHWSPLSPLSPLSPRSKNLPVKDTVGDCDGVGPTPPLGAINRASTHWPSLRLAFSGQFANSIVKGKPRPYGRWRSALLAAFGAILVSAGVGLVCYAPFWLGHSIQEIVTSFSSQPTANFAFNSILAAISVWQRAHSLPGVLAPLNSRHVWNVITFVAIGLSIGLGALWLRHEPTTRTLALVALVSLAALLLVTPWFTDWYVTWLVGLTVVCLPVARDRAGRSLLALALTFSLSAYLTYYYVSIGHLLLVDQPNNITWFVLVCFATVGLPLFAFLLSWVSQAADQGFS